MRIAFTSCKDGEKHSRQCVCHGDGAHDPDDHRGEDGGGVDTNAARAGPV